MAEKKTQRQKILYGICGALVTLALLPALFSPIRDASREAEILFLGDSILGQIRDDTSIPVQVSGLMDVTVINGTFGGTPMSQQNRERRDAYYRDSLTFARLARSVAAEDFGAQQTVRTKDYPTMYFGSVVDGLDIVDYSSIGTVVICYGMNDYTTGSPIANPLDPMDPYTMEGAMRTGIGLLQETYPDLRIIFLSPTYCWFLNSMGITDETCESNDYGGGLLEDYVEAQRRVAQEYGVEFLDLYHDFYPHEAYSDWQMYTEDGIHPNAAGREKIAHVLAEYLQTDRQTTEQLGGAID